MTSSISITVPNDDTRAIAAAAVFFTALAGDLAEGGGDQSLPVPEVPEVPEVSEVPAPEHDAVDTAGYPWDARIHSGGHAQTKNGRWKYKRGVGKHLIGQIEAELLPAEASAPEAPAPAPEAPEVPRAPEAPNSFASLLMAITGRISAGTLELEQVLAIVQRLDTGDGSALATLLDLAKYPNLVPQVWTEIEQL